MRALRLAALAVLMAGCGPQPDAPVAATPAPSEVYAETAGGATRHGTVRLLAGGDTFARSAVAFHVLETATPAGFALITLVAPDGRLYAKDGRVITTTTDAAGAFTLTGAAPADVPFMVQATLARNHRLAAIALPGGGDLVVDEASSQVAALTTVSKKWDAASLAEAEADTRAVFVPADFAAVDGIVAALRIGDGATLSARYVKAFGSQVKASGTSAANRLADRWAKLLGRRPLAITAVAGQGGGDGPDSSVPAAAVRFNVLWGAAADGAGNLYVSDGSALHFLPAADHGPLGAWREAMKAGQVYRVAGAPGLPALDFEVGLAASDQAAMSDPAAAPLLAEANLPLGVPVVEQASGHVFFASQIASRLLMLSAKDFERYGRRFLAGHLYTLAGRGGPVQADPAAWGDGGPAALARLPGVRALALDAAGDVLAADMLPGAPPSARIRVVLASNGRIFSLPLRQGEQPYALAEVGGLALAGNTLFVSEGSRGRVFAVDLPSDLAVLAAPGARGLQIRMLLGAPANPALVPVGLPVRPLLATPPRPGALALDPAGRLVVADLAGQQLLVLDPAVENPAVLGGGSFVEGDAASATFPDTLGLSLEPTGNMLVLDAAQGSLRRLWTARGAR
ncbi:MAG: hypothetical protein JWM80_6559 [Cyanobacteria bacterium RYN_339]|nr:hypothetical protein [Cyanobacteria bacterium RYN_339]